MTPAEAVAYLEGAREGDTIRLGGIVWELTIGGWFGLGLIGDPWTAADMVRAYGPAFRLLVEQDP